MRQGLGLPAAASIGCRLLLRIINFPALFNPPSSPPFPNKKARKNVLLLTCQV